MTPEPSESTSLLSSTVEYADDSKPSAIIHHGKTIGYVGSLSIAINSLAGPAVLQLPFQYQQSGLIPTTLCLLAVGALSAVVCLHTANVVSAVPDNRNFDQPIEFSDSFRVFWNARAYQITQVLFFLCTVCLNMAAIIDTAEVVDAALGVHGGTAAFGFDERSWLTWSHPPCTRKQVKLDQCDPFGDESEYGDYVLTLGYILTAAVFLPICLMDLKENTGWQVFGCGLLLSLSAYFCYAFVGMDEAQWSEKVEDGAHTSAHHLAVPVWGTEYRSMLGVILFNFALVLAIPAWLHEKQPHVDVGKVVVGSTAVSTLLYIGVGSIAAASIPHANVNMLSPMVSGAFGEGLQWASSLFAFFIIGLDIPLFSVLTRYNLTHSGLCSERTANILVVWIPWALSWLLYQGTAVADLLDWGGVLLTSAVAFILPLYLALRVYLYTDARGDIEVYGGWFTSHQAQVRALVVLLAITAAAVGAAIGGQISAEEAKSAYLHSEAYLNGTLMMKA